MEKYKPKLQKDIDKSLDEFFFSERGDEMLRSMKDHGELVGFSRSRNCSGSTCDMKVEIYNRVSKRDMIVTLQMIKVNNTWKVVGIPGIIQSIQAHQQTNL